MQILVSKPNFDQEFLKRVGRARSKGSSVSINLDENNLSVFVIASGRTLGKFSFSIEEENCILFKRAIIEREYCPFEFTVYSLVKYLKRKKIKYICYN